MFAVNSLNTINKFNSTIFSADFIQNFFGEKIIIQRIKWCKYVTKYLHFYNCWRVVIKFEEKVRSAEVERDMLKISKYNEQNKICHVKWPKWKVINHSAFLH